MGSLSLYRIHSLVWGEIFGENLLKIVVKLHQACLLRRLVFKTKLFFPAGMDVARVTFNAFCLFGPVRTSSRFKGRERSKDVIRFCNLVSGSPIPRNRKALDCLKTQYDRKHQPQDIERLVQTTFEAFP